MTTMQVPINISTLPTHSVGLVAVTTSKQWRVIPVVALVAILPCLSARASNVETKIGTSGASPCVVCECGWQNSTP